MNKFNKYLLVFCCLATTTNLLPTDSVSMLHEYKLRSEGYAKACSKTKKSLYKGILYGSALVAGIYFNRFHNMGPLEAFAAGATAGISFHVFCQRFCSGLITKTANWRNSKLHNRILAKETEIENMLASGDFDPVQADTHPDLSANKYILAFLTKLETKSVNNMKVSDVIPKEVAIGGLYEREFLEVVLHLTDPQRYQQLHARSPRGVLMEGPKGTGKTIKASQLAALAYIARHDVNGVGALRGPFVGQSEHSISHAFASARRKRDFLENEKHAGRMELYAQCQQESAAMASLTLELYDIVDRSHNEQHPLSAADRERQQTILTGLNAYNQLKALRTNNQTGTEEFTTCRTNLLRIAGIADQNPEYHPGCILFFDEIDDFGSRADTNTGNPVGHGMIDTLLIELDGTNKTKNESIVLVGATNNPQRLDSALLRPGRLEIRIHIGIPATPAERQLYLEYYGGTDNVPGIHPVVPEARHHYLDIANRTANFSQADIGYLFQKAADFAAVYQQRLIPLECMERALDYIIAQKTAEQQQEQEELQRTNAHNTSLAGILETLRVIAGQRTNVQQQNPAPHPAPETAPVVQPTAVNNTTVPETPIVVNKPPAPAVNNQAAPVQQQDQPAVPAVQQVPQQNIDVQPEPAIPANPPEAVPPLPYDEELELTEYRQMQQNEHCTIL